MVDVPVALSFQNFDKMSDMNNIRERGRTTNKNQAKN